MIPTSIRLAEWTRIGPADQTLLRGRTLSPRARETAAACDRAGALRVRELRGGVEIETRSFIGSIELDGLRLEVVPKIGLPRLMRMVARSFGLGDLSLLDAQLEQGVARSGFVDLLGQALLEQTRRLVRQGFLQEYVMQEERLSTPRGRIDLRSVAAAPASPSVLCRFESLTANHPLHHVVKAGLRMTAGLVADPMLRLDLGRAAERFFPDVSTDRVGRANLQAASSGLTRRTRGYRSILALIRILQEGQSVETEGESARVSVPAFLLDMNRLFERFLERELASRMGPPFRLARQSQDHGAYRWQANPFSRRAPVIRPDLVFLRRGSTIAVADAKYKDYDQVAISTSDLFQVTTYAYACGVFEAVPAFVLYPTVRGEIVVGGVLHFAGLRGRSPARVALVGIPIARIVEDPSFDLWAALQPHMPGARMGA